MSLAVSASVRRRTRRPRPAPPWWGKGPPPHERWPGVTLEIPVVWRVGRKRWESPDGRYYFDAAAADLAVDFFPTFLRHHKGEFAGLPFVLLPYQECILRTAFGWKIAASGLRRFRKIFVAVPKGNGKSPFAAGLELLLLLCDGEPGAEVYAAAADREQAGVVFDTAKVMVEASEELGAMCEVYARSIVVPATTSFFKVLSRDVATKHGPNIHGLCFDEFHAQRTRELFEALQRGMVKRRQPMLIMITTAGDDDESICYEEWEYARRVQTGVIVDDTYLPVIFEAGPEEDWKDPEVLKRVNPGYGITVKADALAHECLAAQNEPRKLNDYLRYHTNRWTNQATAWIPVDWWDACTDAPSYQEGEVVAFGLDMAQVIDLAALGVVVRHQLEQPIDVDIPNDETPAPDDAEAEQPSVKLTLRFAISLFVHFWLPEETLREHVERDRVPYDQWVKRGLVTETPGHLIDEDRILRDIETRIGPRFGGLRARRLGYDPAFVSAGFITRLEALGLQVLPVPQNYTGMNVPCQAFYGLVRAQRVKHGCSRTSHPLRWCAENVAIRQDDAGRIRPVKGKHGNKRIDGIVASVMGLDQLLREPGVSGPEWDGVVEAYG